MFGRCSHFILRRSALAGPALLALVAAVAVAGCESQTTRFAAPSGAGPTSANTQAADATTVAVTGALDVTITTTTTSDLGVAAVNIGKIQLQILVDGSNNPVPCGTAGATWVRFDQALVPGGGVNPVNGQTTWQLDLGNLSGLEGLDLNDAECGDSVCIRAHYVPGPGPAPKVGQHTSTPTPHTIVCAAQGCSHGFWKNHTSLWPATYDPTDTLGEYFSGLAAHGLANDTLATALEYGGGPALVDKIRILLRNAVASLLNAASSFGYPLSVQDVKNQVNAAIASGDPAAILALEAQLDIYNNLGCPLD